MSVKRPILVVEDDPVFAAEIEHVFLANGLVAHVATTATAAIAQLDNHDYAAVVLDLVLRDGDGIRVLELLRQNKRHLPVIVVTGYLRNYVHEMTEFFSDVKLIVSKPFPPAALAASVSAVTR